MRSDIQSVGSTIIFVPMLWNVQTNCKFLSHNQEGRNCLSQTYGQQFLHSERCVTIISTFTALQQLEMLVWCMLWDASNTHYAQPCHVTRMGRSCLHGQHIKSFKEEGAWWNSWSQSRHLLVSLRKPKASGGCLCWQKTKCTRIFQRLCCSCHVDGVYSRAGSKDLYPSTHFPNFCAFLWCHHMDLSVDLRGWAWFSCLKNKLPDKAVTYVRLFTVRNSRCFWNRKVLRQYSAVSETTAPNGQGWSSRWHGSFLLCNVSSFGYTNTHADLHAHRSACWCSVIHSCYSLSVGVNALYRDASSSNSCMA
jgi:hypothetical protein